MTGDGEDVTMAADDDVVAKIRAHAAQLRGRDEVKVWTAADSESGPIDVAALSLARADAATRSLKPATPVEKPAAIPQNRDDLNHLDELIHLDDLDDEVTIPAGDYRALLGLAPKASAVQAAPRELVSHEDVIDEVTAPLVVHDDLIDEVTAPPVVHDDLIDEVTAPPVVHDDLIDDVTEPPVDRQPVAEVPPESEPVQPEPVQLEPGLTRPEPPQPELVQPEPELTRPEPPQPELVQPEPPQPEPEFVQPEPQPSGASLIGGMAPPEASTTFWTGEKQFRASGIDLQPRRERRTRFPLWIIVTLLILLIVAASVGIALAVAATGPAT